MFRFKWERNIAISLVTVKMGLVIPISHGNLRVTRYQLPRKILRYFTVVILPRRALAFSEYCFVPFPLSLRMESTSCVCVFSSHSFWTSSSSDVPAGVTQEEGHIGFLTHLVSAVRALIFLAKRIQPFLSLVDREVEFCVLTI